MARTSWLSLLFLCLIQWVDARKHHKVKPITTRSSVSSTTTTVPSAGPTSSSINDFCPDYFKTCDSGLILTYGPGCYPSGSPEPPYTEPPCPEATSTLDTAVSSTMEVSPTITPVPSTFTSSEIPSIPVPSQGGSGTVTITVTTTPSVAVVTSLVTEMVTVSVSQTVTASAPVATRVPRFGQCAGANYRGLTVCEAPYQCKYVTNWFSYCQ
ncbi:uncharacterized protein JN550_011844 [Neoarthrinium moseri]|uniref:uncharacterized protein n=1 Tax=Neoarthrinium moseri TaxID=1658444 RepID=UPI001FDCD4B3|nr:uncharacterized protein JN550_011844 [Neoarthrinium moseri]KAI1859925.1 hypothetical protein JN550_011844 [Neoarthrinium moseri]